jgi:hypothetical protein
MTFMLDNGNFLALSGILTYCVSICKYPAEACLGGGSLTADAGRYSRPYQGFSRHKREAAKRKRFVTQAPEEFG